MRGILGAVTVCALALTAAAVPAAEAETTSHDSTAAAAPWAARVAEQGTVETGTRIDTFEGSTLAVATSVGGDGRDLALSRIDATGGVVWSKVVGTARDDEARDVVAGSWGALVLSTESVPDSDRAEAFTVWRFGTGGTLVWSRPVDLDGVAEGIAVIGDSYYVVGADGAGPVVARYDLATGAQLARSTSGGSLAATGWSSVAVLRDDVVVLGRSATGAGGSRAVLSRLDGVSLAPRWSTALDTEGDDVARRVRVRDGDVVALVRSVGSTGEVNGDFARPVVASFGTDGAPRWRRAVDADYTGGIDLAATPSGPAVLVTAFSLRGDPAGVRVTTFAAADGALGRTTDVAGSGIPPEADSLAWDAAAGLLVGGTETDSFGPSSADRDVFVAQPGALGAERPEPEPEPTRAVGVRIGTPPIALNPGRTRLLPVALSNDGAAPTTLRVDGCRGARGIQVRWFHRGLDVTRAVQRGRWTSETVAPGGESNLLGRVRARLGSQGRSLTCRVVVADSAASDVVARDAVRVRVNGKRRQA